MAERSILFSSLMVRAILSGSKTQTRRVLTPQPDCASIIQSGDHWVTQGTPGLQPHIGVRVRCPYVPGERLWVRETFLPRGAGTAWIYRADHSDVDAAGLAGMYSDRGWKPGIHMPREASRLTLRVTDVRVQRLREISEEDARAEGVRIPITTEGCPPGKCRALFDVLSPYELPDGPEAYEHAARCAFASLWESINRARAPWASNPWVWAITVERVKEADRG